MFEQHRGHGALAEAGNDDDDELAGAFFAPGDLEGGVDCGSRRDAYEQTFFEGQATGHGDGIVVGNPNDFVNEFGVENFGDEAGADSLDFVRSGLASGENGTVSRLDGDDFEGRFFGLDVFADAGEGATGANAGDEDVSLAVG